MRLKPSGPATDAAVDAFIDSASAATVRDRVTAGLEAAYGVDGRQTSRTAEVMMAIALLMILATFLIDFSIWIL